MNVSLTLPESIVDWANTQEDIQKAILDVLEKHVLSLNPAAINAIKLLKKNSVILPKGMEFQIQQIIGTDGWNALNRSERLSLGRKVRAHRIHTAWVCPNKHSKSCSLHTHVVLRCQSVT